MDESVSSFAFNFNLRRYITGGTFDADTGTYTIADTFEGGDSEGYEAAIELEDFPRCYVMADFLAGSYTRPHFT
jgi:hypothetical protein